MTETSSDGTVAHDSDDLRESIKSNAGQHQFLSAGAGAGKTTILVEHYLHLLGEGYKPAQIVAVTFTEKAAAEMKQRLREECRARARQPAAGDAASAASASPDVDWKALVHELEAAPISTIHGFCARLLREHALVAGLDPEFTVLDQTDAELLLEETIRQHLLTRLGSEQTARTLAVTLGYGDLVRILIALGQNRVKLEGVLADTAYQSPDELLSRRREMIHVRQVEVLGKILEHEKFAPSLQHILDTQGPEGDKLEERRRELHEIIVSHGLNECTTENLSPEQQDSLIAGLKKMRGVHAGRAGRAPEWSKANLDIAQMREAQREFAHDEGMLTQFDDDINKAIWNSKVEEESAELTFALVQELKAALEAYAAAKKQMGAVDFEDLLELTRKLWADSPETLERAGAAICHLLIDEFQDTNTLQKQVLWPLVTGQQYDPAVAPNLAETGGRCLFIVGDAKQSIYRFRGADVTVFNTTRDEMSSQDCCVIHELTRNFRSNASLVEVYNRLFSHEAVMGTDEKEKWEATYVNMEIALPPLPKGQHPVEVHVIAAQSASSGEGSEAADSADMQELRKREARWIAGRLVKMIDDSQMQVRHKSGTEECWEPVRPGDMAILLRAMTDVHIYEQALRRVGLPYYLVVGRGFFDAQEVQDVANFLKTLENELDDVALVGALRSPMIGLSDETLYHLSRLNAPSWWARLQQVVSANAGASGAQADEMSAHTDETIQVIEESQLQRIRRAYALFTELRAKKNRLSLSALVQEVVDRTGFSATLAGQFSGAQLVSNVRKLVELAGQFQSQGQALGHAGLRDFIEHITRLTMRQEREGQAPIEEESGNSIKLITYHSAKGLQWPVVVLPDLCRKPGGDKPAYRFHPASGFAVKSFPVQAVESSAENIWPSVAAEIKEADDREEEAEKRRLFYVGATRARDLLILSAVTKLTGKGNISQDASDSPLGWVSEALNTEIWTDAGSNSADETLWKWHEEGLQLSDCLEISDEQYQPPALPTTGSVDELLPHIVGQVGPVAETLEGQLRFTATELSLYHHCPRMYELQNRLGLPGMAPVFGTTSQAALNAMELGTVVHRVLQLVGSGGVDKLGELVPLVDTPPALPLGTDFDRRAAEQAASIHAHVRHFVDSNLYDNLFQTDSDLRSEVGLSVLLTVGGKQVMIEGKVDALVHTADGQYHLLDYKTGQFDEAMHEQYRVQLGLYCYAVEQATGCCPATASLVYLTQSDCAAQKEDVCQIKQYALDAAERAICGIWARQFEHRTDDCSYCHQHRYCKEHPSISD
jgi:ATP-dependent helicase/nuclease subunit A